MPMKILVCGVHRRHGVSGPNSKNPGREYDFSQLLALWPIQSQAGQNGAREGYGFEQVEYDLDPACIRDFAGLSFPCEVEVETRVEPNQYGAVRAIVTGLKRSTKAA